MAPPRTSDASSQTKQRNQETGSKSKWDSIKILTSKTEVLQMPSAIEVFKGNLSLRKEFNFSRKNDLKKKKLKKKKFKKRN